VASSIKEFIRHSIISIVAALGLMVLLRPAHAVDRLWNNPAGGVWETAANWMPTGVPLSTEPVFFNLGRSYAINFSQSVTTRSGPITIRNDDVTFDFNAAGYGRSGMIVLGESAGQSGRLELRGD
jgi:hypothetical protein